MASCLFYFVGLLEDRAAMNYLLIYAMVVYNVDIVNKNKANYTDNI